MVSALVGVASGVPIPTVQTYDQLVANFPAANYVGYPAYTSDVGPVWSNGVTWSYPLTEGTGDISTYSISSAASDRYPLGLNGQELSVWYANGVYNATFTNGGSTISYMYNSTDPTVPSNWSTPFVVLGAGTGGQAGTCAHSYVYIEGGTIYIYYIELSSKNIRVAAAPLVFSPSSGPVFSAPTTVFTGVVGGGSANGNCCVVKVAGTYYMFQESLWGNVFPVEGSTSSFQIAMLTCATVNGTFVLGYGQVSSIRPSPNGSCSGADVKIVGSNAVMYYHGSTYSRAFPDDIFRATIPLANIATDTWTITQLPLIPEIFTVPPSGTGPGTLSLQFPAKGGNYNTTLSTGQVISMTYTFNSTTVTWSTAVTGTPTAVAQVNRLFLGNPALMKRAHFFEFDQIADPYVCTGPNGVSYLFYEGCNNRTPSYQLMVTPLLPTPVHNDGPYAHPVLGSRYGQPPYWNNDDAWTYRNYPLALASGQGNAVVNEAKTGGTWAIVATAGAPNGSIRTNTSAVSGDFIEYDVTAPPGTYTLNLNYQTGPANGIFSIYLYDGFNLAPSAKTVDSYAASGAYASSTITNIWILGYETFRWRLRMACTSKNASSTGFTIADCGFTLQRTGL